MPTLFSNCSECNDLSYLPDNILNTIPNYTYKTHIKIFNLLRNINVKGIYLPNEICIKIIKYLTNSIECHNCISITKTNKKWNTTLLCPIHLERALKNCKMYGGNNKMMCYNCCWANYKDTLGKKDIIQSIKHLEKYY